jgi:uncharacterized protein (TIGR02646 family)
MRQINKGIEPVSLTTHRNKAHANYDNYPDKDDVRQALCWEQRGICCYCMGPIEPLIGKMKIEHFKCQNDFEDEDLIYRNMLGACMGNEGQAEKHQHCDTFKDDKALQFYPPDQLRDIGASIWYKIDGTIGAYNTDLDTEIEKVLNLNTAKLKNNRKAVLDAFLRYINKTYMGSKLPKPTLEKWLAKWNGDSHNDNLQPYCQVIVYWLRKRLNRA